MTKWCTQTHTQHSNSQKHHMTLSHTPPTLCTSHIVVLSYIPLSHLQTHPNAFTHTSHTHLILVCVCTYTHSQHPHLRPATYIQYPNSHPLEPKESWPPTLIPLFYENTSRPSLEKIEGAESKRACLCSCSFLRMWVSSPLMGVGWGTQTRGTE